MVYLIFYLIDRNFILKWTLMMIYDKIDSYETNKTLASAIELCQFLLDTDQVLSHEGRKYKSLCNYLLLEGCCYDVGYII